MREEPRSRDEKLETLQEAMSKRKRIELLWKGYEVNIFYETYIFYTSEKNKYTALIPVKSGSNEERMLTIGYDSALKPTSLLYSATRANLDVIALSADDLPENLRGCENELAEFILNQDFEGTNELDGWTR